MAKPTSFNNLTVPELKRSAAEDFAVEVPEGAKKDEVIAALVESGVTWADYVAQHPEVAPDEPKPEASSDGPHLQFTANENVNIITAESPVNQSVDRYLLKMTRDNVVYETQGLRFTQSHPFALATADQADYILAHEDGFTMASPSEAREFYS